MKIPDPVKKARHKRFDRSMIFSVVAAGALVWLASRSRAETPAALGAGFVALAIVIGLTTFILASWLAHRRRRTRSAQYQPPQPQPQPQPRRRPGWSYTQDGR